jgi:hypothetical protein
MAKNRHARPKLLSKILKRLYRLLPAVLVTHGLGTAALTVVLLELIKERGKDLQELHQGSTVLHTSGTR